MPRPRFEPRAAGWEARTPSIVLCSPPLSYRMKFVFNIGSRSWGMDGRVSDMIYCRRTILGWNSSPTLMGKLFNLESISIQIQSCTAVRENVCLCVCACEVRVCVCDKEWIWVCVGWETKSEKESKLVRGDRDRGIVHGCVCVGRLRDKVRWREDPVRVWEVSHCLHFHDEKIPSVF